MTVSTEVEVSRHFYTEFLPEARALKPDLVDKTTSQDDKWIKGLPQEEREDPGVL